ncbi:hypothetical protein BUALT_Bualt03G0134900 [Buddleja alternifolia]|uniref:Uncharacterized protein n=1 Tax=Buddleja alternifolia TaxID=168488 RepID=A0AAV6Y1I2_9LAMI|nr:hypothetical protein BUALT_Bualt03G0134900 [Buddleja alternifolia]
MNVCFADAFDEKHGASTSAEGSEDGFGDLVGHTMFEKGLNKRIWGEHYKVSGFSDVVVQVCKVAPIPGDEFFVEKQIKRKRKEVVSSLAFGRGGIIFGLWKRWYHLWPLKAHKSFALWKKG